jgi:hypothetical protein
MMETARRFKKPDLPAALKCKSILNPNALTIKLKLAVHIPLGGIS